jgi:hypothetical protein
MMTVNLDRKPGFDIDDPKEVAELSEALAEGVILVIHPCGGVWQFEGGEMRNGNFRTVTTPRSSVIEVLDKFGITDDDPKEIRLSGDAH